jgi:hypothetical protein
VSSLQQLLLLQDAAKTLAVLFQQGLLPGAVPPGVPLKDRFGVTKCHKNQEKQG